MSESALVFVEPAPVAAPVATGSRDVAFVVAAGDAAAAAAVKFAEQAIDFVPVEAEIVSLVELVVVSAEAGVEIVVDPWLSPAHGPWPPAWLSSAACFSAHCINFVAAAFLVQRQRDFEEMLLAVRY